jgi:GNAT superfamily N-acetyltransferase
MIPLPTFLPGRFTLAPGTARDYDALARFHYLAGRPATFAAIVRVAYAGADEPPRVVAVGVLSYPAITCFARERALGLCMHDGRERARFVNAHVRTISRVIVHPQFRALGLATALVRRLIEICPTRYVEAIAHMGRAHPLFERAGMRRFDPPHETDPVYFLLDRTPSPAQVHP